MNYEQIKDLIKTIDNSSFAKFKLKLEDMSIKMSKEQNKKGNFSTSYKSDSNTNFNSDINKDVISSKKELVSETIETMEISEPITIIPEEKTEIKAGNIVYAPMVGTFYEGSSPLKPPFVKVGDKVKKGDVICIIEAMKIMNEITSQYDGEIAEILIENESMVEYNQPLFRIV